MDYPKETALINDRAKLKLARDLGDSVLSVLMDPRTIELMLNADGKLWQERLGEPMHCFGTMRSGASPEHHPQCSRYAWEGIDRGTVPRLNASSRSTAPALPARSLP